MALDIVQIILLLAMDRTVIHKNWYIKHFVLQKIEEMDTVRQCLQRLRVSVSDEDHRTLNTLEEVRKPLQKRNTLTMFYHRAILSTIKPTLLEN